jgi:hypothetical protein
MEEYISFHKIITQLQYFQEQNERLNSFGYGNLVDFGKNVSGTTVVYPFMFVIPQSIQYDENTTTYQLSILFADRLNETLDNEVDAISDMSLTARLFLSEIKRGTLQDYFDITLPQQGQPFLERFNDNVAGVALDANIIVYEDVNACPQYPTPTPSNTPNITPTITPTNTPTNTVTPSITPTNTVTPTVTNTPGLTPSLTPSNTPSVTPSITPTLTPTPSSTPIPIEDPSELGATWWVDFTSSSNLILDNSYSPPMINAGKDLISGNYVFSADTGRGPQYSGTGYFSMSGVSLGGAEGLTNALGVFSGASAYTVFINAEQIGTNYSVLVSSENIQNYLGQQQGYRWFSIDNGFPNDSVRCYSFNTNGNSTNPEVRQDLLNEGWKFIAIRVYASGSDFITELWVNGVNEDDTTMNGTLPITATDPIYLIGRNAGTFNMSEAYFFDRKLTDAEMAKSFNYLNNKYPLQ